MSPRRPERVARSISSLRGTNILRDVGRVWTPQDSLSDGTFNAVIALSLLQMAADAYQSSRDCCDDRDRAQGRSQTSYESSLNSTQRGLDAFLVKTQFLAPREGPAPSRASEDIQIPAPPEPVITSDEALSPRWLKLAKPLSPKVRAFVRPLGLANRRSTVAIESHKTPMESSTPVPRRSSTLPAGISRMQAEIAKPKPLPPRFEYRQRANTLSGPFQALQAVPEEVELIRNARRRSLSLSSQSSATHGPAKETAVVHVPDAASSESLAKILEKPMSRLSYSDITSACPRLIRSKAMNELSAKRELSDQVALVSESRKELRFENSFKLTLTPILIPWAAYLTVTSIGYSIVFLLNVACFLSRVVDVLERVVFRSGEDSDSG